MTTLESSGFAVQAVQDLGCLIKAWMESSHNYENTPKTVMPLIQPANWTWGPEDVEACSRDRNLHARQGVHCTGNRHAASSKMPATRPRPRVGPRRARHKTDRALLETGKQLSGLQLALSEVPDKVPQHFGIQVLSRVWVENPHCKAQVPKTRCSGLLSPDKAG